MKNDVTKYKDKKSQEMLFQSKYIWVQFPTPFSLETMTSYRVDSVTEDVATIAEKLRTYKGSDSSHFYLNSALEYDKAYADAVLRGLQAKGYDGLEVGPAMYATGGPLFYEIRKYASL